MELPEKLIITILRRHFPRVMAIYLFGSFATGEASTESDLDLALLLPWKTNAKEGDVRFHPAVTELAAKVGRRVDLISLRCASTDLQVNILRPNRVLFCRDHFFRLEFEGLTLSFFQKLNEERRPIVNDILQRGRVH